MRIEPNAVALPITPGLLTHRLVRAPHLFENEVDVPCLRKGAALEAGDGVLVPPGRRFAVDWLVGGGVC